MGLTNLFSVLSLASEPIAQWRLEMEEASESFLNASRKLQQNIVPLQEGLTVLNRTVPSSVSCCLAADLIGVH
jgi:hypothetical protein